GGDGHGGGVADDHGPVDEGAAALGVGEVGELGDGLDDLAGAFAAGDHDDDVHGGVAGDEPLEDGLAGAEGAGDAGGPSQGDGEEGVDDADGGHQGFGGVA